MKIAILTLPLHFNYGGILQAFAMCHLLKQMGHEPYIVEERKKGWKTSLKRITDRGAIRTFIEKQIPLITTYCFSEDFFEGNQFETVIVGSDQVWRTKFINKNFFLPFLKENYSIKKMAFSASFGNDQWECDEYATSLFRENIATFRAVSVREYSGVLLCEKYLNIRASWTLDPTMLLPVDVYSSLFSKIHYNIPKYLYIYILGYDNSNTKQVVSFIGHHSQYNIKKFHLTHNKLLKRLRSTPGPEEWLSNIYYSSLILTDSFHACVFSILFNKPFFVVENEKGGNTRIDSLLKTFQLENRKIKDNYKERISLNESINWSNVNRILNENREQSHLFLEETLNK